MVRPFVSKPGDRVASQAPSSSYRIWSDYAPLLLGKGIARAHVFGHQYGCSRGGVSRRYQTISDRDVFRGAEESWFPSASIASVRSATPLSLVHCCVFSLYLA